MPRWSRRIDPAIEEAIREGARAGVFRVAARLNPATADTWAGLAEVHSSNSRALLCIAISCHRKGD